MDARWLDNYPAGTSATIALDESATLISMFEASCQRFASLPAFHNMGATLTYADLERRSRDFAAYLQACGFRKGERIAIMTPNVLQYPIALFGALRAGMVVVNTNPLYTVRELSHQLKDSGASVILVLANFAHVVEKALAGSAVRTVLITELGDLLSFPKGAVVNWAVRRLKKLVPEHHIGNAVSFKDALKIGADEPFEPAGVKPNDLAFLQYTGGTTGVAKGAMLSHRNMVANLEQVSTLWKAIFQDGAEVVITPLPLYHVFCLTCNCLLFTKHGGLNVLITNPRDIPGFIAELKRWRFTFISGVSTLYQALLNHPRFSELDFSKLKFGVAGGMALAPSVAERWESVTGKPLIEGYGLTEASPVVACNLPSASRLGAVGLPLPATEISIRADGRELGFDEEGELCVRGPQVMQGYWNMPEETTKTLEPDGWLHTGDIAALSSDGWLRILDRKKDMIIVSGFKVFPNEVENVLSSHEQVTEVGCIGVPDEKSGQAVKAYVVVRQESSLSVEQVRSYCREHLTAYKVPKYVEFRDSLPKTPVGKILRRELEPANATQTYAADPGAGAH